MGRDITGSMVVDPWPRVRRLVTELVRAPAPLLLVADFDGTLSPITPDPRRAHIEPAARVALRRLSRVGALRPGRLVLSVLSGRSVVDVASRVRVGGVLYIGNHGLEWCLLPRGRHGGSLASEGLPLSDGPARTARDFGDAVAVRLGRAEWLHVEQKGPAVAFHYRSATDPASARHSLLDAISAVERSGGESELEHLEGRKVIELRPRRAAGKGASVERMLAGGAAGLPQPASALILGDDQTDAVAFRVVRTARQDGRLVSGLIVGVSGGEETPTEVLDAADAMVGNPRQVARVLSTVAAALERESGAARSR